MIYTTIYTPLDRSGFWNLFISLGIDSLRRHYHICLKATLWNTLQRDQASKDINAQDQCFHPDHIIRAVTYNIKERLVHQHPDNPVL